MTTSVSVEQHIALVQEVGEIRGELSGVQRDQVNQREEIRHLEGKMDALGERFDRGMREQSQLALQTAAETERRMGDMIKAAVAEASKNAAAIALSQVAQAEAAFLKVQQQQEHGGASMPNPFNFATTYMQRNPFSAGIIAVLTILAGILYHDPSLIKAGAAGMHP